ncbi:MAG: hypothetical protein V5A58_08945 [Salinibacter sp.]
MRHTHTTTLGTFSLIRWLLALLVVPALLLAGCDSNDSGMEDPPPDNGDDGEPFSVAHYDTTDAEVDGKTVIEVSDNSGGENSDDTEFGIGYSDQDGNDVSEVTWSNDFVYRLDNFVFVNDGETLSIDPGTLIQGMPGDGADAAALIISRGGTIEADGNPGSEDPSEADPIIFTAQGDDGSGFDRGTRGLWGGVILLGDATINSEPPTTTIEGVPDDIAGDRADYGAENSDFNDDHDIGTFRFVSIRHTGSQLGGGDEIQGLTLGGVGSGSTIEYVESYASDDDGFEFFGGTVNTKYLISAFVSDDNFDIDEGWRGSNQFWLAVQDTDEAGRIGEHDGGTDPEGGQPFATSKVANATYIGVGPGTQGIDGDQGEPMLIQRDNNATSYYNTIFMDGRTTSAGLEIEDRSDRTDARERAENGDLVHENNLWWNVGANYDPGNTTFEDILQITEEDGSPVDESWRGDLAQVLRDNGNQLTSESPIQAMNREDDQDIVDFDPRAAGPATNTALSSVSGFGDVGGENSDLVDVSYKGAFGPNDSWAKGWTLLDQNGELQ